MARRESTGHAGRRAHGTGLEGQGVGDQWVRAWREAAVSERALPAGWGDPAGGQTTRTRRSAG